MRQAMLEKMLFWLEDIDIDGFRCDMADLTPVDFCRWAVPVQRAQTRNFMLAESENPVNTERLSMPLCVEVTTRQRGAR